jgi:molybdopterin-containing oxidoreductase family membrane subunit
MTLFGTIGLFQTLMFVFVRLLPMISITEVKMLLPEANPAPARDGGSH